ncbi:MAG: class I SAM-dependent methyltransferase [Desulfobulbaceae bacterium]|nr:class I SAM-dependent methyltransferase [Desulfobulbaceae bacterium]
MFDRFLKIVKNFKSNDATYEYQLKDTDLDFDEGVVILSNKLKNNIVLGSINNTDPECIKSICNKLKTIGLSVENFKVDIHELLEYITKAEYKTKYPDYYKDNFYEKTLEHFLCYKLLELREGDKFIDIASEFSPVWEIFKGLTNCTAYSQDIMYEPGIHGNQIGSNASQLPVQDEFFDAAIATCSIEHFENDSDVKFMKEMCRVLKKNGKIVVVPLYLFTTPSCQTDPKYSVPGNVSFDDDAEIFCSKGWGNRHGRFYSPQTLYQRLIKSNKNMDFQVYLLENPEEINASVYCRYILLGTKR